MKRADKIRLANEAIATDDRDQTLREAARTEWGQIRRTAREAFLAHKDWVGILNNYRIGDGFYTSAERIKMCDAYENELVMKSTK